MSLVPNYAGWRLPSQDWFCGVGHALAADAGARCMSHGRRCDHTVSGNILDGGCLLELRDGKRTSPLRPLPALKKRVVLGSSCFVLRGFKISPWRQAATRVLPF